MEKRKEVEPIVKVKPKPLIDKVKVQWQNPK